MPAGDWFVVQAVDAAHAHAIVEVDHFGSQPLSPALREYEIDQAAADWVRLCARITMPPPLPTPSTTASGPCPFSAAQLAALATDTSALGGLGQTDVSMALPTQAQQLGVCAAFIARWAHSDDVLTSDPAADDNREHNELLLAFPSAEDASNAFQTLIAQLQPDERTRILDTPSLGEEALAVQSYSSAELVTEPDGRIHEVPDDADFTFLFRRGPVLVVSDDKFSANSADMGLASMLAQAIDSRIVATLK